MGNKYPHRDGDVIVLGPEVFATTDGSVVCWKGENYTPQRAPLEELRFRVRLLRHDASRKIEGWTSAIARRLPLGLRRAVIVDAAVRATRPEVIGPDAYAGPDGLDYVRLMEAARFR